MFRMRKTLLGLTLLTACAYPAQALDVNEIIQLTRSGVQDSVIINVVQSHKLARPLTSQEVIALSAGGVSPALLEYLTRPEAVSGSYVPPSAPVITTTPAPSVTYVDPAPTVVASPPVVVAAPPTVYYSTPYYAPRYVYPRHYAPYRHRPSFSFGISIGGGRHRWRDRGHYRPGRPFGGWRR